MARHPLADENLRPHCNTDNQRSYLDKMIETNNVQQTAEAFGVTHKSIRRALGRAARRAGLPVSEKNAEVQAAENEPDLDCGEKHKHVKRGIKKKRVRRYVVTCAQNATPIHSPTFRSIERYCEHNNATLIVIPTRYKNPTSMWTSQEEGAEWWAAEITPHLLNTRVELCENLVLLGDIRIQPTATRPTSGLETFTGGKSAVIGHPKLELVTIATPQNALPKVMMTTGSITQRNYTDSRAGKKGEHHHTYAATVIEISGNHFYFRQINASDDGKFYDIDTLYTPNGVEAGQRVSGLVLGDLHHRFVDEGVVKATFSSRRSIINATQPEHVVYHDVMDFYSQNHHHRGKVFTRIAKHKAGRSKVEDEINELAQFIDQQTKEGQKVIFVPSNHPDALARWVEETDWRSDPENAEFYLETAHVMSASARMGQSGAEHVDPFAHWMRKKLKCVDQCHFPERDESYQIEGIEVSFHGDRGPGGARGSIRGFGKIGVKTIIGHSHTPGIMDGVYQVGTSSKLRMEYNTGPSSWLNCHALIYPDGKRTLISIIDGRWRA